MRRGPTKGSGRKSPAGAKKKLCETIETRLISGCHKPFANWAQAAGAASVEVGLLNERARGGANCEGAEGAHGGGPVGWGGFLIPILVLRCRELRCVETFPATCLTRPLWEGYHEYTVMPDKEMDVGAAVLVRSDIAGGWI